MRKFWNILKAYKHVIVLGLFILVLGFIMWGSGTKQTTYIPIMEKEYQEVFDLAKVPSGMIIWRHGIPGTETEFLYADSASRYEYFNIGILSKNRKVYKVKVPFYAMGLFPLGGTVNMLPIPKGEHPNYKNNTIPKGYNKQIKKINTNL